MSCCDCTFLSFASWSRYCAARSNCERRRRLLHALGEPRRHHVALPLQEQHRVLEVARVVLLADEADARRRAALDLVLHARAAAVLEVAVLALAQLKELVQLIQRLAHGARVRIGAEQLAFRRARPAVERQARETMLRLEQDVRIALVVAQHHVEARPVLLDEVVLEHQRFDFGARDRDFDAGDGAHHRDGLARRGRGCLGSSSSRAASSRGLCRRR